MNFIEKLAKAVKQNNSRLCIGLDPDQTLMPPMNVLDFNKAVIDATSDLVCAYKPNLAFYEALGIEGLSWLQETVKHIPSHIPVIGDGKRADIGNTSRAYARSLFDGFGFDAVTVNPYLGYDSIEPFIRYNEKGILVLCRTSNPGSADLQSLVCIADSASGGRQLPLFQVVAEKVKGWNTTGNTGLVIGATFPAELKQLRELCPEMVFLIPGVGSQGGDLEETVRVGMDSAGDKTIINSSRQVLYASKGSDFAAAARKMAAELRDRINQVM